MEEWCQVRVEGEVRVAAVNTITIERKFREIDLLRWN